MAAHARIGYGSRLTSLRYLPCGRRGAIGLLFVREGQKPESARRHTGSRGRLGAVTRGRVAAQRVVQDYLLCTVGRRLIAQYRISKSKCRPRKRHVWGTRQSRWFRGPAALLCELSLFVLAVTSRKIDPRSDVRASDIKRPVIVPHTAARRKLWPRPLQGCRGLLFT